MNNMIELLEVSKILTFINIEYKQKVIARGLEDCQNEHFSIALYCSNCLNWQSLRGCQTAGHQPARPQ